MENLNAEAVKRALECCANETESCDNCPYLRGYDENCFNDLKKDALALINSQEQRIKELAEEIFAEIEKYNRPPLPECEVVYILKKSEFAELKKKYTEVAERREDIENSPADCSTPSVTDQKGEGE